MSQGDQSCVCFLPGLLSALRSANEANPTMEEAPCFDSKRLSDGMP